MPSLKASEAVWRALAYFPSSEAACYMTSEPASRDDAEQNLRISALSRSFAEVCQERGRPFVEAVGPLCESSVWVAEVSAGDGAHPQKGGYDALADLLIRAGLLAWITGPIATGTPTGNASAQVQGGARV